MTTKTKTRTSITIDPSVLEAARILVKGGETEFRSVAALIQTALTEKLVTLRPGLFDRPAAEPVSTPPIEGGDSLGVM